MTPQQRINDALVGLRCELAESQEADGQPLSHRIACKRCSKLDNAIQALESLAKVYE